MKNKTKLFLLSVMLLVIIAASVPGSNYSRDDVTYIVTDHATGLMWEDTVETEISYTHDNWETNMTNCEALTLGGYDDWHLPNIRQLESLLDFVDYVPASEGGGGYINPIFKSIRLDAYASSTTFNQVDPNPDPSLNTHIWVMYYTLGRAKTGDPGRTLKTKLNYRRCVRVIE